jgi:leucyl aminopeptidase (aminopeptidase T)
MRFIPVDSMTGTNLPLQEAATQLLTRFLQIRDGETLWAFTDLLPCELGRQAINHAAEVCRVPIEWLELPAMQSNGEEPPEAITTIRPAGTPVLAYTSYSLSSTSFRSRVCADGGRFYSVPGGGPALALLGVQTDDLALMKERGQRIKELLEHTNHVRLVWDGFECHIPLSMRPARLDLGLCNQPGAFASPSFEVNTVPLEYGAHGQLDVLAALPELTVFDSSIRVDVVKGSLTDTVDGNCGEAERWKSFFAAADPTLLRVAELGFGLNHTLSFPAETYMANESVWRTVHIGIGRNLTLGGTFSAPGHVDLVMRPCDIIIDETSMNQWWNS